MERWELVVPQETYCWCSQLTALWSTYKQKMQTNTINCLTHTSFPLELGLGAKIMCIPLTLVLNAPGLPSPCLYSQVPAGASLEPKDDGKRFISMDLLELISQETDSLYPHIISFLFSLQFKHWFSAFIKTEKKKMNYSPGNTGKRDLLWDFIYIHI